MNSEFFPKELTNCNCGKRHTFPLKEILSSAGAINALPEILKKYGLKKPFVVADTNTFTAAGEKVLSLLKSNGVAYSEFVFSDSPEPDESAVQAALNRFDSGCDAVIGVGSGVINDICKIVAKTNGRFYIIVATAPSMDGYASATSSMTVKGLKTSVSSKCPEVIIGDLNILKNAPEKALVSGLGDMIAKYISVLEWRLSHEINGEYYCENVADIIRFARDKCVKNAQGLISREENAVKAVFDGLIISGLAMAYAGVSRPASGVEHYISHVIDMRGIEFNLKTETHGVQCAVATLIAVRLYERLKSTALSDKKGETETRAFSYAKWESNLRDLLGGAAEPMIELEEKEKKYDFDKAAARRKIIISKRDGLKNIIEEELPSSEDIEKLLKKVGLPLSFEEAGLSVDLQRTFAATKDIRDKYVLSSLLWDLGLIREFCAAIR